jgi:hypothetical protein
MKKSQPARKVVDTMNHWRMMPVDVMRKDVVGDGWKGCQGGAVGKCRWVTDGCCTAGGQLKVAAE